MTVIFSTPCGTHTPIAPDSFAGRVDLWHARTKGTTFLHSDFAAVMDQAKPGDLIYCDPPDICRAPAKESGAIGVWVPRGVLI